MKLKQLLEHHCHWTNLSWRTHQKTQLTERMAQGSRNLASWLQHTVSHALVESHASVIGLTIQTHHSRLKTEPPLVADWHYLV